MTCVIGERQMKTTPILHFSPFSLPSGSAGCHAFGIRLLLNVQGVTMRLIRLRSNLEKGVKVLKQTLAVKPQNLIEVKTNYLFFHSTERYFFGA